MFHIFNQSCALALLAYGLLNVTMSNAQTQTPVASEEEPLRQLVKQVENGWNAHDSRAFSAPFAADADYVVVNGMYLKGRETIDQGHAVIFNSIYKNSHNVGTVKAIRFLRPDVAVAHVEWDLEFQAGDKLQKSKALNTMVLTKEAGQWHIAAFHNTPVLNNNR
ncbi:SgcJ/EcaC family oxidoreductase [Spirosoma taeanense]|uniref:SgcJ/EcaC family oxidoreductase n=1 Tax=Spirosoma taeanense TaxID=2735870 RepID=A0A6M5Y5G7_9BACT|nr:SgcJ/EcaC family oxidoreductase [Spirosoma taeanense]QJW89707.1 SgcJ/EcaC family oxidoreductase [Spirosoma taeanense]